MPDDAPAAPSVQPTITAMLSVMMFLQFFVWGAWFVTIGVYLSQGVDFAAGIETAYSVGPIAAIVTPLILGLFADRFFQSRHVLAVCHLACAGLMAAVPWSIDQELAGRSGTFFWVLLSYALFYYPTLGLTSTLAMQNIQDAKRQFPVIRVFGTLGWIAAGLLVGTVLQADEKTTPMYVSATASVVLGGYAFFLPGNKPTPPTEARLGKRIAQLLGLEALGMFKDRNFLVFGLASLLLFIPLQAYYAYAATFITDAGFASASGTMIWGQITEIVFMLLIPFFFKRLGVKWMLIIGLACWALRYVLFAAGAPAPVTAMLFGGILLHGICYDFFFVTGQIYTDEKAPKAIQGQAQGLFVVLTQGVGMFIGAKINGALFAANLDPAAQTTTRLTQWQSFWWVLAATAAAVLVGFFLFFREKKTA